MKKLVFVLFLATILVVAAGCSKKAEEKPVVPEVKNQTTEPPTGPVEKKVTFEIDNKGYLTNFLIKADGVVVANFLTDKEKTETFVYNTTADTVYFSVIPEFAITWNQQVNLTGDETFAFVFDGVEFKQVK